MELPIVVGIQEAVRKSRKALKRFAKMSIFTRAEKLGSKHFKH